MTVFKVIVTDKKHNCKNSVGYAFSKAEAEKIASAERRASRRFMQHSLIVEVVETEV